MQEEILFCVHSTGLGRLFMNLGGIFEVAFPTSSVGGTRVTTNYVVCNTSLDTALHG